MLDDQLLFMAAARFLPSSVIGGTRPLAGSTISEVCRSGRPRSNQLPEPSLFALFSRSGSLASLSRILDRGGIFLVGEHRARAEGREALHRRAPDAVERPCAAQIGIAPRRVRRRPAFGVGLDGCAPAGQADAEQQGSCDCSGSACPASWRYTPMAVSCRPGGGAAGGGTAGWPPGPPRTTGLRGRARGGAPGSPGRKPAKLVVTGWPRSS